MGSDQMEELLIGKTRLRGIRQRFTNISAVDRKSRKLVVTETKLSGLAPWCKVELTLESIFSRIPSADWVPVISTTANCSLSTVA